MRTTSTAGERDCRFLDTPEAFRSKLFSIALPVAMQSLMAALVSASDALMLGRLSQNAIAAVSLANQISFVMNLFVGGILGGAGSLITQYYGNGDLTTGKKVIGMSLKTTALISLVFFSLAWFTPETLMRIYTSDEAMVATGARYLRIVSWSYVFGTLAQTYLLVMRITGRAGRSAWISSVTVVVDMAADLFLIYGLAGAPRLEVAGCAISTVVVEALALLVCVADSLAGEHLRVDAASFFSFSKILYRDMLKIALPTLASALCWGLGYSAHSLIMGHLGEDAAAANAVILVVKGLVICFCKGVASASGIMVGMLLGQNRLGEAKACGERFWRICLYCGLLDAALFLLLGPLASRFFVLSPQARAYLLRMSAVMVVYLIAHAFNTVYTCGVLPAGGDAIYDAVSVAISMWCFSLPLGFLGTFVFHWPVMAVYVLIMLDEIVKVPWLYRRVKQYRWLQNLTRSEF